MKVKHEAIQKSKATFHMPPSFKLTQLSLLLLALAASGQAMAFRLEDAAVKAVQTNPDVLSKWHELKATVEEGNVTRGRYLPTLDVIFNTGRDRRESPLFVPLGTRDYNFNTTQLILKQNLFEGFATQNDSKRLQHAAQVRLYELINLSESTALEAAKAYIDVRRYRQFVSLAEDSYATHRVIHDKSNERSKSGVGRKVDFETAAGRLALAESNLVTETANLYDVSARYQRIVGSPPPADMDAPPTALLASDFPNDRSTAISRSFERSPQLKGAFENILSANHNVAVQKAGYYPRVDAYAQQDHEKDTGGYPGVTNATTVGLTVSWNLFRGYQDISRERKAIEERDSAKDVRERVCREVRQNAAMAFNDHGRLTEQLQYLDQRQLSTDKAREAFRRQFDIGQRTLLDVLDTENEYFTSRRDYVNAQSELQIADAKYQAVSGDLLKVLNLKRLDMDQPRPETTPDEDGVAPPCQADVIVLQATDKEAIFKRAMAKEELNRNQNSPAAPSSSGQ
jgi:adhesin transport system outer membrane protein